MLKKKDDADIIQHSDEKYWGDMNESNIPIFDKNNIELVMNNNSPVLFPEDKERLKKKYGNKSDLSILKSIITPILQNTYGAQSDREIIDNILSGKDVKALFYLLMIRHFTAIRTALYPFLMPTDAIDHFVVYKLKPLLINAHYHILKKYDSQTAFSEWICSVAETLYLHLYPETTSDTLNEIPPLPEDNIRPRDRDEALFYLLMVRRYKKQHDQSRAFRISEYLCKRFCIKACAADTFIHLMLYEYLKRNDYRVLRTFEWRSSFGTWMCAVSGHLFLNMLKHLPDETTPFSEKYGDDLEDFKTDDDSDDAITVCGINFTEGFIYEMLANMSTQYPDIVLQYLQGQNSRQIAAGLRIPTDIITSRIRNEVETHRMLHRYFNLFIRREGAGRTDAEIIIHSTGIESKNVRSKLSYVITLYEKYINGRSYDDIARMLETNTANVCNNIYPRAIRRAYGTVQRLKAQAGIDIRPEIAERIEKPNDVGILQAIYTRREDFGEIARRLNTTPENVAARYHYATEQALSAALYMEENNDNQKNESK